MLKLIIPHKVSHFLDEAFMKDAMNSLIPSHFLYRGAECMTDCRYYFVPESRLNCLNASSTVAMNCAGKMMVEFFSVAISAIVCSVRSWSATGCAVITSAA